MKKRYELTIFFTAIVWLLNGLGAKILNLVPRHQEIVETILPIQNGRFFTVLIGTSEIIMAVWILSKLWPKLNAITQITIVMVMNIIEQIMANELLLWGDLNFLFAVCFSLLIVYNEFVLKKKIDLRKVKT